MRPFAHVLPFTLAASVALLWQCTTFPALQADTCGNGVIDPGEDCDGFAKGRGTACGAPGTTQACRLDCVGTAACPDGWGCGVSDSICRQPSGKYQPLGQPVPAGAWRVTLADFDGDQRMDALTREKVDDHGTSRVRLHYLGTDGSLTAVATPSPRMGSPLAVDLTGDGLADLAFVFDEGISVMVSQPDRTLAPHAYPILSVPGIQLQFFAFTWPNGVTHEAFWGSIGLLPGSGLYAAGTGDVPTPGMPTLIAAMPDAPDSVTGAVQVVHLLPVDANNPCPQLVYATKTAARWLSPCATTGGSVGWNISAPVTTVSLPAGVSTCNQSGSCSAGVRVGDLNGDGNMDLLIGATARVNTMNTYVAYGDGAGTFYDSWDAATKTLGGAKNTASGPLTITYGGSPPPGPPDASADADTGVPAFDGGGVQGQVDMPLAAGDMNGDGLADLVTSSTSTRPSTILISQGYLDYVESFRQPEGAVPWTEAAIADLNGNHLPDVIAGSNAGLDLAFFNGTGTPFLYPFSIPTTGNVAHFAVSDFDGDLLDDLAFSQTDPTGDTSDQVAICYGLPFGAPTTPLTVGRFQRVFQISTEPPTTTLFVVSTPVNGAQPASSITGLGSTGDRPPLSSYRLATVAPGSRGPFGQNPVGIAAGIFSGQQYPDLAAVGVDPSLMPTEPPGLWLAQNANNPDDPASFLGASPESASDMMPPTFAPGNGTTKGTYALLLDSAVIDGSNTPSLVAVAPDTGGGSRLVIGKVSGSSFTISPGGGMQDTTLLSTVSVSEEGQIALADVDGDKHPDLVLLTDSSSSPTRSLVVFWNDGQGHFTAPPTEVNGTCTGGDCPQGFALLNADVSAVPQIVFVSHSTGVTLVQLSGRTVSKLVPLGIETGGADAGPADASTIGGNYFLTGVAAGDINGDGVDDLAVINNGTLDLFAGVPMNTK